MKKLLLTFLIIGSFTAAKAQLCTPTWTGSGSGIQPDTTENLPHAMETVAYNAVIQFKVPLDTTYLGFPATINHIQIDNVTGLSDVPASPTFTYVPNPTNGQFPGGSVGCVSIQGTPNAGSAGTYPIVVNVTANATTGIGTIDLPYTVEGYRIVVDAFNGISNVEVRKNGLVATPSITNALTTLNYFTTTSSDVVVSVINTLGQQVIVKNVVANAGYNEIPVDLSKLQSGQYIVTLLSHEKLHTTKVLLNK